MNVIFKYFTEKQAHLPTLKSFYMQSVQISGPATETLHHSFSHQYIMETLFFFQDFKNVSHNYHTENWRNKPFHVIIKPPKCFFF